MKTRISNTNISILLGLIALGVAVAFRLFSEADLWFQMFSAILGVIITVIITNLLLLRNLFDIVEIFRHELYSEKHDFNRADINAAIENFEYAYRYFLKACPLSATKSITDEA